ncbi:hypothetical protein PO124_26070 [Bacillus licheniformis]|nr:hypothetical protein [Bacillus licheniformis]
MVAASIISFEYDKRRSSFADPPCQKRKILVSKYVTSVLASIWLLLFTTDFYIVRPALFGVKLDEKRSRSLSIR